MPIVNQNLINATWRNNECATVAHFDIKKFDRLNFMLLLINLVNVNTMDFVSLLGGNFYEIGI